MDQISRMKLAHKYNGVLRIVQESINDYVKYNNLNALRQLRNDLELQCVYQPEFLGIYEMVNQLVVTLQGGPQPKKLPDFTQDRRGKKHDRH